MAIFFNADMFFAMGDSTAEIRSDIQNLIQTIEPFDVLERSHQYDAFAWVGSGVEIFRLKKPDVPNKHLVSYFCVFDWSKEKILLVEHKNAGLWLPPGGHVEKDEHPKLAVERECLEELGFSAKFWRNQPVFITSSTTVGHTAGHTDVSLWYALEGDSSIEVQFDKEEFHSVRWFGFNEIPFEKSDPHLRRFVEKLKALL